MTTMMTEEMNDEVQDFLAHYGVKGMRWGHRKAQDTGGSSSGGSGGGKTVKSKPAESRVKKLGKGLSKAMDNVATRDAAIANARLNQERRHNEMVAARKQMKRDTKMFSKERKAGRNDIRNMKLDILNKPDAVTASKMTSGEIFAATLFGGPGTAGAIASRTAYTNQLERRQATGYFESKKRK